MIDFDIRPALKSDMPDICAIEDDSFPSPYPRLLLESLLRSYPETFFVATYKANELIGYCVCSVSGRAAHLVSIAVQSNYRRRGVATSLLDRLVEHLKAMSVEEMWLEVSVNNEEGVALYSKWSFEEQTNLPNYYSDGSDALRMRLVLSKDASTPARNQR